MLFVSGLFKIGYLKCINSLNGIKKTFWDSMVAFLLLRHNNSELF